MILFNSCVSKLDIVNRDKLESLFDWLSYHCQDPSIMFVLVSTCNKVLSSGTEEGITSGTETGLSLTRGCRAQGVTTTEIGTGIETTGGLPINPGEI